MKTTKIDRKPIILIGLLLLLSFNIPRTMGQAGTPLDVNVQGGSLYFPGENATFYILVTKNGDTVNATIAKAEIFLAPSNQTVANLTSSAITLTTGYFSVKWEIPDNATAGDYGLLVRADFGENSNYGQAVFQVRTSFFGLEVTLAVIQDDIAELRIETLEGIHNIQVNLTAINATLSGLIQNNGELLVAINSTQGLILSTLGTIQTKLFSLQDDLATITSILGNLTVTLDEILVSITLQNSTLTDIHGAIVDIVTYAGSIEGQITNIENDIVTIETNIGTIRTSVENIQGILTPVPVFLPLTVISVALIGAGLVATRRKRPL